MKVRVNTGCYWAFFFLLGFWINGLVNRARTERACAEHLTSAILYGFESGMLAFGPEAGNASSVDQDVTNTSGH